MSEFCFNPGLLPQDQVGIMDETRAVMNRVLLMWVMGLRMLLSLSLFEIFHDKKIRIKLEGWKKSCRCFFPAPKFYDVN